MFVSIIIPAYNAQDFIGKTIKSILDQSYSNFEIIVVDDNSTDATISIVEQMTDARIKLIKLDKNAGGPAKPRNVGLQNSTGEVVAFCDSDDLWHKDKLDIQISTLINTSYDMICSDRLNFINLNCADLTSSIGNWSIKPLRKFNFKFINPVSLSSVIAYKRVFDFNTFNEDKRFIAVEDYLLWLEIIENYQVCKVEKPLLLYRIHSSGIYRNKVKQLFRVWRVYRLKFGHLKSVYHLMGFCISHFIRIFRNA